MVGLYYPAVLGAGLVFILTRLGLKFSEAFAQRTPDTFWVFAFLSALGGVINGVWQDYANLWGIGFLILFSASFVVTDELTEAQYEPRFFRLDALEVLLIFFAYWFLGLADTASTHTPPFLPAVYFLMAIILTIDEAWSRVIPTTVSDTHVIRGRERSRSVAVVRVLGILWFLGAGIYTSRRGHEADYPGRILIGYGVVLAAYLSSFWTRGLSFNQRVMKALSKRMPKLFPPNAHP
jgi:hypothetical protein